MLAGLTELFRDGDFRFHLTLRRVEPADFYRARDESGLILAERARWMACSPDQYAAATPAVEPVAREFAALASTWLGRPLDSGGSASGAGSLIHQLGTALEPDLLFLTPDADGQFRLRGGVLCFPTGWVLTEKLGHTLDFIHAVVPGLNNALGSPIHQFLSRLRPGPAFLRDNWGIAASAELNLHPARRIPPPQLPANLEHLWLRVEHQALLALPNSRGIVFAIRIALHRLSDLAGTDAARGLRRALETMPREVIAYKRVDQILPYLLNVL